VVVAQLSQAEALAANYLFALSKWLRRWHSEGKLWLGFSGGGAAKASRGWVLAASVVSGRWRLRDEVMHRPAEAGLLLTPAGTGCKLVGYCRARLFTNCAAKLKFP